MLFAWMFMVLTWAGVLLAWTGALPANLQIELISPIELPSSSPTTLPSSSSLEPPIAIAPHIAVHPVIPAPEPGLIHSPQQAVSPGKPEGTRSPQHLHLPITIQQGYHIQANPASHTYLIPITLTIKNADGNTLNVSYPPGKPYRLEGSDMILSVYDGLTYLSFSVPSETTQQPFTAELRYQACDNRTCFPPETIKMEL